MNIHKGYTVTKPAILGGTPVFDQTNQWPSWPKSTADDERRLLEVLHGGQWGLESPMTAAFTRRLAEYLGVAHVLPVNSGTAALELAVKALGIGPGDEVIVPAYTFVASATCVLEMGATVVFADIDPDALTICPKSVASLVSPRTKAVIMVHFGGNPCDIEGIKRVVSGKGIALLEDAAHAHGMLYRGQAAGKLGTAACYSYQSSKNMSCGEGGVLVTDDKGLFELAESFHSFGRKPGRPWYEHHHLSWNHRITGFQSAVLMGQLERLEEETAQRYENAKVLDEGLAGILGQRPQKTGDTGPGTRRAHHVYIWRFDAQAVGMSRDLFMKALAAEGLATFGGYPMPIQQNPMFMEHRYWHRHRPGADAVTGEPDYRNVKTPSASAVCADAVWFNHRCLLGTRAQMQGVVESVARVVENARAVAEAGA